MENLKVTSIRLSKAVLAQAAKLAMLHPYYTSSEIIRVALWVGLKFLKPRTIREFLHMMWQEEHNGANYELQDVLRTAGETLENPKRLE